MVETLHHGAGATGGAVLRIDPRVRIVMAGVFAIINVGLSSLVALSAALCFAVVLMVSAGLQAGPALRRMLVMDVFILFILLLLPFTVPGEVIFTLWGFPASQEGLVQAAQIGLRANASILALMALVGTLDPTTLGQALCTLKVPPRLVHLMMFTIRYITVLKQEYQRMRGAMRARGFQAGTNLHTYRTVGYLVGMMLIRAIERSERILDAMKCRGFTGRFLVLDQFRLTRGDGVAAAGFGVAIAVLVVIEVRHALV